MGANSMRSPLDIQVSSRPSAQEPWVHASRDTLRVVLRSSDALVAPTSLRAAGNGLYRAEIVLPSTSIDAGPFSITVYIIHVDGQGLEDPPPHPFMEPIMLLAARHPGPPGYNIPVLLPLAISVAEPAAAGALDATGAHRGPTPLLFDAADVPDVAVEAATPLPRTASVGLGRHRVVSGPGSARRRPTELPLCVDGARSPSDREPAPPRHAMRQCPCARVALRQIPGRGVALC